MASVSSVALVEKTHTVNVRDGKHTAWVQRGAQDNREAEPVPENST